MFIRVGRLFSQLQWRPAMLGSYLKLVACTYILYHFQEQVSQHEDDTWSACARDGYAVKPGKGDALLFFSLHPDATPEYYGLHGSFPVIEGEKWSTTKWIRVGSWDTPDRPNRPDCLDLNDLCPY